MFDYILVPLDGSLLAECVLPHVVALAKAFSARVAVISVLSPKPQANTQLLDPLDWVMMRTESETYLERITARLSEAGIKVEHTLLEGSPAERVIEYARSHPVKLIILSSHGRSGLSPWNISSVVQNIILRAPVSTMIIRAYQPPSVTNICDLHYDKLLVMMDLSQRAEFVLPAATSLASYYNARLYLAHVVQVPEAPRLTSATQEDQQLISALTERNYREAQIYLEQLQSRLPVNSDTRLLISDRVNATLHQLVEDENFDLVMLSAHGYSGGSRWPFGSTTISFIAYGSAPLLIAQDLNPDELPPTKAEVKLREQKGH